ncbi:hypothetical protein AJ80_05966 [Polytolypa hystricis UAMH7299]|uniref:DUF7053 domain-containing protein n=1 Tax=Polytolypa hystricis (strain UAMH7299) TaxID=1447883 RepID=A0A2B7XYU3_POLH7|nr:hypothetical protein AJ80_05966 [Polytolypa hystricis UAMH7299]
MSKRSIFTTVTPIPSYVTRDMVVEMLHNHTEMIELNPLVIKHSLCKPPPNATSDEYHCVWYELTDKIQYLPGGMLSGNVSYKACFYDLPRGLQTHVYAPAGLDIKEKWSVCGNMPGEPRETVELGLKDAPRDGLYLREDVDMTCNILMMGFVKKTLKKAHGVLIDRLVAKANKVTSEQGQLSRTATGRSVAQSLNLHHPAYVGDIKADSRYHQQPMQNPGAGFVPAGQHPYGLTHMYPQTGQQQQHQQKHVQNFGVVQPQQYPPPTYMQSTSVSAPHPDQQHQASLVPAPLKPGSVPNPDGRRESTQRQTLFELE